MKKFKIQNSKIQKLTIDPAAILPRQKRNHPRHILRHRTPPQRTVTRHGALDPLRAPLRRRPRDILPRDLGEHIALDATGSDGINRNTLLAEILGEALRDAIDGGLGAGIEGVVRDADEAGGDAGHEDDAAAGLAVAVGVLGDEELGAEVEAEDEVEAGLGDVLGPVEALHARVGADDVDAAEVRQRGLEEPRDLGDPRHVGLDGDGARARGLDLPHDARGVVEAFDVVDHDGGAAGAEFEGDAGADAAGGAGHEGDFAGEGGEGVGGEGGGGGGGGVAVCGFRWSGAIDGGGVAACGFRWSGAIDAG